MTKVLQEFNPRISAAENVPRFPLHLQTAVELECKLVFRLYGALESVYIILLKLMLCKGVIMFFHVVNPLKFQNFLSGSVIQLFCILYSRLFLPRYSISHFSLLNHVLFYVIFPICQDYVDSNLVISGLERSCRPCIVCRQMSHLINIHWIPSSKWLIKLLNKYYQTQDRPSAESYLIHPFLTFCFDSSPLIGLNMVFKTVLLILKRVHLELIMKTTCETVPKVLLR